MNLLAHIDRAECVLDLDALLPSHMEKMVEGE